MVSLRRLLLLGLIELWVQQSLNPLAAWAQPDRQRASGERASAGVRVMTANVRYGTANDGEDRWELRRDLLVEVLRQEQPDLIGTQEMLPFQAAYLQQQLGIYDYVGRSRELDNADGEQCGIFYRRERFVELERGHFWLSDEPERPGSQAWDAALPRMATWLKLFDRTTQRVLVIINTHFDHRGDDARLRSAQLVRRYAARFAADYPLIVTGDFNCPEASPPYAALCQSADGAAAPAADVYRQVHPDRQPDEGTFHGFQGGREGGRIDWILASAAWRAESARIVAWHRDGRYPSDHYPVVAELRLAGLALPDDKSATTLLIREQLLQLSL
jgi:endonuclease/exonuclease/phosphatase family metal-dependent hydrolase